MNAYFNTGHNDTTAYWDRLMSVDEMDDELQEMINQNIRLLLLLDDDDIQRREIKWNNKRLNWKEHVERELHTGSFKSKYHMPILLFENLVDKLRDAITVDYVKSMNSTSGNVPIYPEIIAAIGLRFLGGEFPKSLEDVFGVDITSVPRVISMFFNALFDCNELAIKLPQTASEVEQLANGFSSVSSSEGLFDGCVGAIDGWLCQTIQPIDRNIRNKRDYFSGHYQCFGLNIQAICDHKLRFIYFGVTSPGKTGDARAFNKCVHLKQWMDMHLKDTQFFFVGDNAYVLRDELLIPFNGNNMTEAQRTYNFHLSQMRIRIEMAFGRLTTKWRIFRRKLEGSTRTNARICRAAAILHNYVINGTGTVNEDAEDFIVPFPGAPSESLGYLPVQSDYDDPTTLRSQEGNSYRRMAFLRIVQRDGLTRPLHNLVRNEQNY